MARGKSARQHTARNTLARTQIDVLCRTLSCTDPLLSVRHSARCSSRMRRDATSTLIVDFTSTIVSIGRCFLPFFFRRFFHRTVRCHFSTIALSSHLRSTRMDQTYLQNWFPRFNILLLILPLLLYVTLFFFLFLRSLFSSHRFAFGKRAGQWFFSPFTHLVYFSSPLLSTLLLR